MVGMKALTLHGYNIRSKLMYRFIQNQFVKPKVCYRFNRRTKGLHSQHELCSVLIEYYSKNPNYLGLLKEFDGITNVFTDKLRQFVRSKFSLDNIFGFSFGGQIVLEGGRRLGKQSISWIDGK